MKKTLISVMTTVALLALPMAGVAAAGHGNGNGNGNGGAAGCTLAGGEHFKNPAGMLKFLTERDGHFQNTVAQYDFDSVGDLINRKCGA